MAYPVVDNDVFRVTTYCRSNDQVSANSFQIQAAVVGAVTVYQSEVAAAVSAQWSSLLIPMMPMGAEYLGATVRRTHGAGLTPRTSKSVSGNGEGTVDSAGLPRQTAGLVSFYTPFGGAKERGRVYIPFPASDDNEVYWSRPTVGYVAGLNAVGDWMIAGHVIAGTVGNITVSAGFWNLADALFHRFDAYQSHRAWATQRRRGSFGKVNASPFV